MLPDIGISNGVMSVILNYAKAMPDDIKFDVVYFADKPEIRQREIEELGGRVYRINPPSPKGALKGDMDHFFSAHKGEWEVLHINAPHFAMFIAPMARRAGIKKICMHCHSTLFSLNPENQKRNELFYKMGKGFTDKKFACSKMAGDYWYKKDYTVLNNAIDCSSYGFNPKIRDDVRKELQLEDKLVVTHIGRTDIIQKNHPFLLRVFAEIKRQRENAVLMLIGAKANKELTALCKELGIADSVMFLGVRRDVSSLLQGADVFVFPSTREGLPVSVVEAQASGLPVIMSDTVTNEVIVTDNAVMMSLDETPERWAKKALELSSLQRKNNYEIMKSAGWNIYDCANLLVDYYRS